MTQGKLSPLIAHEVFNIANYVICTRQQKFFFLIIPLRYQSFIIFRDFCFCSSFISRNRENISIKVISSKLLYFFFTDARFTTLHLNINATKNFSCLVIQRDI
ncbi:hypothetical protein AR456_11425 [Halomonas huangheensis]|nr:hypothetical protein AR456_11425 [Halomonas huangheensis]